MGNNAKIRESVVAKKGYSRFIAVKQTQVIIACKMDIFSGTKNTSSTALLTKHKAAFFCVSDMGARFERRRERYAYKPRPRSNTYSRIRKYCTSFYLFTVEKIKQARYKNEGRDPVVNEAIDYEHQPRYKRKSSAEHHIRC